ncbi:MAG: hypothetical protein RIR96_7 [Bacteroidota bacterium]|jgi:copper homeostasis protein
MKPILEVIAFNLESCLIAERAGADRIELCDNPGEGGTTPSYGLIKMARLNTRIHLFPIIRPRGGDFLYTHEEFELMKVDIEICKNLGCDGIVTGILLENGDIDKERMRSLVTLAYPMGVTFHRAFDRCNDPLKAMEDIIECGCERILTSGQRQNAMEGIDLIALLIEKSADRIIIMPGSGIRSDNINEMRTKTGASEFHSSARVKIKSKMEFVRSEMNESLEQFMLDENEVKKMVEQLQKN